MMEEGKFCHFTKIQQRFNDYDILGHVNNAVYQHYLDIARISYFQDILKENITSDKYSLIMANISIDYFFPINRQENTQVSTRISMLGNKSLGMEQVILNPDTGEIKASSTSTLVVYSIKEKSTTAVPDQWKMMVRQFEKEVVLKQPGT